MKTETQNALRQFSRLRAELAACTQLTTVKQVRDKAEALRGYHAQIRDGLPMQNEFAEIVLRAERRAGEILTGMDRHRGGRPKKNRSHDVTGLQTLRGMGIEKMQAHRWQRIAGLPEELFEDHIVRVKAAGLELTTAGMLRLV